jgi:hypothetical protein
MAETHFVGKHRVTLEEDIIRLDYSGDYSGADAAEITRICSEHVKSHPRVYALCDITQVGVIAIEARQVWIEWLRKHTLQAIVCYGAGSFSTRAVLRLFVAAARVLLRFEPRFVFMPSETEARAWIHQHRARNG